VLRGLKERRQIQQSLLNTQGEELGENSLIPGHAPEKKNETRVRAGKNKGPGRQNQKEKNRGKDESSTLATRNARKISTNLNAKWKGSQAPTRKEKENAHHSPGKVAN